MIYRKCFTHINAIIFHQRKCAKIAGNYTVVIIIQEISRKAYLYFKDATANLNFYSKQLCGLKLFLPHYLKRHEITYQR